MVLIALSQVDLRHLTPKAIGDLRKRSINKILHRFPVYGLSVIDCPPVGWRIKIKALEEFKSSDHKEFKGSSQISLELQHLVPLLELLAKFLFA